MEPFRLIGVYPLGWGAGWTVTGKRGWVSYLGLKSQWIGTGL